MPYLDVNQQLPFQSGSETSREAAVRARSFVGPQGEQVYAVIAKWSWDPGYGRTQKEIAEAEGLPRASVCARVRALEQQGRIEKIPGVKRDGCAAYRVRG
jgi:hypothetical protein